MTLCAPSLAFGMSSMISAPISGRKTARLKPQLFRKSFIELVLSS
ncbi:unannotated protein [freshwater metagenome]|uniref:Unannotated protein n=1 Tax=freshwater metagenome TaxID=449393 RepID=A0A6J7JWX9_9ZZZZ